MELERHEIERTNFSQARRGYDPEEVDRHLAEIATSVDQLKRTQTGGSGQSGPGGLAGAAAEQVRVIVDAAERSAAEIESSARAEADSVTRDAKRQAEEDRNSAHADAQRTRGEADAAAQETREKAESDAAGHVAQVQEATADMRSRADTVQSDLAGLVDELRATLDSVVESVRTNAGSLEVELQEIKTGLSDVREAAPEPPPVEIAEPEVELGTLEDDPAIEDTDVVVEEEEAEAAEPLTAHDEDAEPVETAADQTGEEPADDESLDEAPKTAGDESLDEAPKTAGQAAPAKRAEPEPESEDLHRGSGDGAEGARLIALNMALNGTPRDETSRYLEENFDLDDHETILDEVYARVGG